MEGKPSGSLAGNEGKRSKKKLLKGKKKQLKKEENPNEELACTEFSDSPGLYGGGDGDEVMASSEMTEVQNILGDIPKDENDFDVDSVTFHEAEKAELADAKSKKQNKRKRRLGKEAAQAVKRGVCYLSRIPPHMDHVKLRHILSQYGEVQRIYLMPEDPAAQVKRKRAGGFRGQVFSEGWVEFAKRSVAKRVADMLNGEQIGGKKRSSFYYDIWNIKYLKEFSWDDLTEETAYKKAVREQKLALELSAAKRERDFVLSKADQSRALASIEERLKKKRKVENSIGEPPRVIRQFPQKKPVTENASRQKPRLSKEILAGVFGSS